MELKERTGIKTLTLDRYLEMLPRIYEAIGHLKLSQIRPQHLNEFYMNLSKPGARTNSKRATPKPIFNKHFESLGISKQQLARESGVSPQTISAVTKVIPCAWRKQRLLPTQWVWISRSFSM